MFVLSGSCIARSIRVVAVALVVASCSSTSVLTEDVNTTDDTISTTTEAATTSESTDDTATSSTVAATTTTDAELDDEAFVASVAIRPDEAFDDYEYEVTTDEESSTGCDGVEDPGPAPTTAEYQFELTGGHFLTGIVQAFDDADAASSFLTERLDLIETCSGLPSTDVDGSITTTTIEDLAEADDVNADEAFRYDLVVGQGSLGFRVSSTAARVDRFLIVSFGSDRATERSISALMLARIAGEAEPQLVIPSGSVEFFDPATGEPDGDSSFNPGGYALLQALTPELESQVGADLITFITTASQDDLDAAAMQVCLIFDDAERTESGAQQAALAAIGAIRNVPGSDDLDLRTSGEAIGFLIVAYCPSNGDVFSS